MASPTRTDLPGQAAAVAADNDAPDISRRLVPVSLAVLLIPAIAGLVRLLIGLQHPFAHSGDAAILETAVRRVSTGTQALGPYSRFGFHQPGPAYFFVQAPFSWITGGSSQSLFLGALFINLSAAIASVSVVRRHFGEVNARWTAAVVGAYLLAVTPALLADPWNPYVLGLPFLLTMVLAAAAASGSAAAWAGSAVIGSFVVQSHVGTAPTLLAVTGVAAAIGVAGRNLRRTPLRQPAAAGRLRRRWLFLAAGVVFVLFWIPPLVEQATHSPGNLTKLVRFFGDSHPDYDAGVDHRLGTAANQVTAQLATVPFGRAPADIVPARTVLASVGLILAGAVSLVGWRRRDLFVTAMGGMSLVGTGVAIWSTTRIVGEVMPYLLVWVGVLLAPTWIGLGVLFLPGPSDRRITRRVLTATAGAVAAILAWSMLRAPLPPVVEDSDARTLAALTAPWLRARSLDEIWVRFGEHAHWPLAAGVINELDRDGVDVSVDREWTSLFGDQFSATGRELAELWLTNSPAQPPLPNAERLGAVGRATVWAAPRRPVAPR